MVTQSPNASTSAVLLRDVTQDDLPIFFEQQLDASGEQIEEYLLNLSAMEQRR